MIKMARHSSTLESRLDDLLPSPKYSSVAEVFPEAERPAYRQGQGDAARWQ